MKSVDQSDRVQTGVLLGGGGEVEDKSWGQVGSGEEEERKGMERRRAAVKGKGGGILRLLVVRWSAVEYEIGEKEAAVRRCSCPCPDEFVQGVDKFQFQVVSGLPG